MGLRLNAIADSGRLQSKQPPLVDASCFRLGMMHPQAGDSLILPDHLLGVVC